MQKGGGEFLRYFKARKMRLFKEKRCGKVEVERSELKVESGDRFLFFREEVLMAAVARGGAWIFFFFFSSGGTLNDGKVSGRTGFRKLWVFVRDPPNRKYPQ